MLVMLLIVLGGVVKGGVDDLAIRKQSCLSGSSDADSFVFALSL